MEEDLQVSEEYKKWFNGSYKLREQFPKIFQGMKTPENEPKEITQAFEAGRKEYEREYGIDREREELRTKLKNRSRNRDRDAGRGR